VRWDKTQNNKKQKLPLNEGPAELKGGGVTQGALCFKKGTSWKKLGQNPTPSG